MTRAARRFGAASALAGLALALAACDRGAVSDRAHAEPATPSTGGTCVIGMFSDLDGLNEFTSTDANATDVMEWMLYMPLLRWGEDLRIEGRLARSWTVSDDGLEITMQLRDDVRWHDGVPTTAADVVFTFDRFRDPELGYPGLGTLRSLESVEALGPCEVRFRFSRAYANQLSDLRRVIMPEHLLGDIPSAEMGSAAFNRAPVGNGPFRFVRWKRQQELVLEANPDFPDGRPWLDRVVFRTIPDQTAIETAFLSGQIDVVDRLRFEQVEPMRRSPRVQVLSYEQRGYQFIGWNFRDPLFEDPSVRRALTMAIDRQRIVDTLVFGEGKVTAHPVMSLSPYYDRELAPWPYDPAEAARLLEAAGWIDRDGDGVRDRDGVPFSFELVTNLGNQLREDTLVMIQDQLARVGIEVRPRVREWSVFLHEIETKRFQAFHMAWQTDFKLDPYDVFHSASIEGKYNMISFSDPVVDDLIERGTRARTAEEAMPVWKAYQERLHELQPYTVLFELRYSVGAARRVRDIRVDVRSPFVGVQEWWIAPSERRYAS